MTSAHRSEDSQAAAHGLGELGAERLGSEGLGPGALGPEPPSPFTAWAVIATSLAAVIWWVTSIGMTTILAMDELRISALEQATAHGVVTLIHLVILALCALSGLMLGQSSSGVGRIGGMLVALASAISAVNLTAGVLITQTEPAIWRGLPGLLLVLMLVTAAVHIVGAAMALIALTSGPPQSDHAHGF
ncbi:hypothetical protein [Devriesea agamarum]|uniref:hypothetical protein n=1 Tax=Devriesea agamarum TaxID=472569 RepID=UPI00071D4EE5|nr:hypothetical protein [Devriesea agamarum]